MGGRIAKSARLDLGEKTVRSSQATVICRALNPRARPIPSARDATFRPPQSYDK